MHGVRSRSHRCLKAFAWVGCDGDQELRRLAHGRMAGEQTGHTLQTTALVNEAYLRLVDCQRVRWQDRAHFLANPQT